MDEGTPGCNILLAVGGLNPQVITEGLFCLVVKKKILIDEIFVLTTRECKDEIGANLKREILRMAKMYRFEPPRFSNENILYAETEALGSDETFQELSFKTIQKLTKAKENTIHCLISGGRKTMSVDVAFAMGLFARDNDRMYHILASKEFEASGKYFPETKEEAESLLLKEKQFIRLRHYLSDTVLNREISYRDLVGYVQREIEQRIELKPLTINIEKRSIRIGDKVITFPPFVFAVYLFFAKEGRFIRGGKNFSRSNSEKLWKIYRRVSTSRGQLERVRKYAFHNGYVDFDVVQKAISNIRNAIKTALSSSPLAEYYTISVEGSYADKKYGIRLGRDKIRIEKKIEE
ncbi:MAG: CRISPR-associated ring nuclease Csm6 [Ignavibacteria bacterium]|nr:CRISPR-associated ring nuclease Csm6 [Ignavibacteria bacterium]